jgi:hypothetical protein
LADGNKAGPESLAYLANIEWDAVVMILMEAVSE